MLRYLAVVCLLAQVWETKPLKAEPVVIIHPDCKASGDIELVRKIFLGKEGNLCGGSAVQPVDVDGNSPLRPIFLDKIIGKNENQLRQYWSRLVFTGKATPPRNVGDDNAVKVWVSRNKDAVGIVDSSLVDGTVKAWIKVP